MFRAQVIGNLGADAKVEQNNGRPFVSFNVAHNDRYTREDGTVVEKMQWISCAINGDGGKLLQFLKKGRQVYVEGRASTRVFSSEKERRMVAGVNLSVDHVELIGGAADAVPGRLFDNEGVMHNVNKSYWIDSREHAILLNRGCNFLYSAAGEQYKLTAPCWVDPVSTESNAQQAIESNNGGPEGQSEMLLKDEPQIFDGSEEGSTETPKIANIKAETPKNKRKK